MSWITIEDDDCIVVMPETDSKPHGVPKRKNQRKVDLAWMDCPCKPRLSTGTREGAFEKPMIIHNSFEEDAIIDQAMNEPFSSSPGNGP